MRKVKVKQIGMQKQGGEESESEQMMKLKTLAKHNVSIFQAQANYVKRDVCNDLHVNNAVFYACPEF